MVALLRAVGHVLDKVDGAATPALRRAVDEEWRKLNQSKPEPAIFWSFIDDERNVVVKEYRFRGAHAWGVGVTSLTAAVLKTGETVTVTAMPPGDLQIHVFDEGPFAGRQHHDVADEALRWWRSYLDGVDALVPPAMPD